MGAVALNGVLGVPKTLGLLLSVTFVVLYTMGGGLIAVVNTDVVQFIIIVGLHRRGAAHRPLQRRRLCRAVRGAAGGLHVPGQH